MALILYRNYPQEIRKAKKIAKNVFDMAKELKMENWPQSEELKKFYEKNYPSNKYIKKEPRYNEISS